MKDDSRFLLRLGWIGVAILGWACAKGPQFEYKYQRPTALGPLPDSIALVVPVATTEAAQVIGERKARLLAQVLGIRLDPQRTVRQVDQWNEILRLKDDRYRLKVYVPSGMVEFRDTRLYNQTSADEERLAALTPDTVLARARLVLRRLQDAGLVSEAQIPLSLAHVSYRKEQDARGANQGERAHPAVPPATAVDTRVFVPRVIGRLGVSGNGVRITFTKRGEVAGIDLLWRDLVSEGQRLPLRLSLRQARAQFERSARIPSGAVVDVLADELVYFDPSTRDAVSFLEPGYLFVYRVRVPVQDGANEFRISKVLHWRISAVDHGRQQLPSARAARLAAFRAKMDTTRPTGVKPSERTDENEVPAGVCPEVRAPRTAIQLALNQPEVIEGWWKLADTTAPFDAARNPYRNMLALRHPGAPYHARSNPLVFRAVCK